MFQKAWAPQRPTIGFALFVLLTCPIAAAQLPSAPSPAPNRLTANREAAGAPQSPLLLGQSGGISTSESPSQSAERRPVPSAGPALQTVCPGDVCSPAQMVMCCGVAPDPFARYLKRPEVAPLTADDKFHLAVMNVFDPFNLLTIGADAAVGVALDSHSAYGPGFEGFAKYAGVSLTENMTGEFLGTFLVPSLARQDPRYHREPFMPVQRRILHAITQVVWAQSDSGRPMLNYGNIVGGIATATVSNTFVPGPGRQGVGNTSKRLALAFAFSPVGNLITEFVPDVARHINLKVVIFQRILNTISIEVSGTPTGAGM